MHMPNPQYFQDIEGKIPAGDGDPVALIKYDDGTPDMIQSDPSKQPAITIDQDNKVWIEGSLEEGRYLEST